MNREVQVRICEGLGVKLPGPTRQKRRIGRAVIVAAFPQRPDLRAEDKALPSRAMSCLSRCKKRSEDRGPKARSRLDPFPCRPGRDRLVIQRLRGMTARR